MKGREATLARIHRVRHIQLGLVEADEAETEVVRAALLETGLLAGD